MFAFRQTPQKFLADFRSGLVAGVLPSGVSRQPNTAHHTTTEETLS